VSTSIQAPTERHKSEATFKSGGLPFILCCAFWQA
jgi:hypothetical protein